MYTYTDGHTRTCTYISTSHKSGPFERFSSRSRWKPAGQFHTRRGGEGESRGRRNVNRNCLPRDKRRTENGSFEVRDTDSRSGFQFLGRFLFPDDARAAAERVCFKEIGLGAGTAGSNPEFLSRDRCEHADVCLRNY